MLLLDRHGSCFYLFWKVYLSATYHLPPPPTGKWDLGYPREKESRSERTSIWKTKWKITEVRKKIPSCFQEGGKKKNPITIETNVVMTFIRPLFCSLCCEREALRALLITWGYLGLRFGYRSFLLLLKPLGSFSWSTESSSFPFHLLFFFFFLSCHSIS